MFRQEKKADKHDFTNYEQKKKIVKGSQNNKILKFRQRIGKKAQYSSKHRKKTPRVLQILIILRNF